MKVVNITRGELTPEEKTAINVLASIDCSDLDCEFCPINNKEGVCVHVMAMRAKKQLDKE